MTAENFRIYAQLQPDAIGLRHLQQVQDDLPVQTHGRRVPHAQLHMTLVHFGKVFAVYEAIKTVSNIPYEEYALLLADYIQDTEAAMPHGAFDAQPITYQQFGQRGGTLVITYNIPSAIKQAHQALLVALQTLLSRCGVADVLSLMQADPNLVHALTLAPHITVYKGYAGELPSSAGLQPVTLTAMPVVYAP